MSRQESSQCCALQRRQTQWLKAEGRNPCLLFAGADQAEASTKSGIKMVVQELGTLALTVFTLLPSKGQYLRRSGPILQIFLLIKTVIHLEFSNRLQL